MKPVGSIHDNIYEVRGERIMLANHLASLYEVPTKMLNLAVKRNIQRFPSDFMFQLTKQEFAQLRVDIETQGKTEDSLRFQIETSKKKGGIRYLPYAFTEQGIAMLSSVLHSQKAIDMNIAIMRAFVEVRRIAQNSTGFKKQLKQIMDRISEHDIQLNQIYEAMENMLDETVAQKNWARRERIGFK